jgi:hypothetical protein
MCLALSGRVRDEGDVLGYAAAAGSELAPGESDGRHPGADARGTRLHRFRGDGPDDPRSAGEAWRETVARTLRGAPFKAGVDRFVLENAGDRLAGPLQRLCEMLAAPDPWINFET